jgi:hypothetical protein
MRDDSAVPNEPIGAFTVAEFCQTYRVGRNTFYGELKAERLSARKVGKKTLVLKAEAERWAQALPKLGSL